MFNFKKTGTDQRLRDKFSVWHKTSGGLPWPKMLRTLLKPECSLSQLTLLFFHLSLRLNETDKVGLCFFLSRCDISPVPAAPSS